MGSTHERFRIGDLDLDSGTFTLRRGGEEIALPRLSFELLLCLAHHAPNVVTTDTLMDEVWGKVVVSEETVKQRIKLLRKALGDSSSDPRYISSVRGRGYRLLAGVSPVQGKRRSLMAWLVPVFLLAALAIGIPFMMQPDSPDPTGDVSVAGMENLGRGSTENVQAYDAYLKGRVAYRRWTQHDNETALAFYQRAATLDPGFALAVAGIANVHALRATEFRLGEEGIDEAILQARRALELEPELPEALKALGICYVYKGHYQTALDYYRSALRLAPDYDEVIFNISELLQLQGRWDEAVKYQRLDTHRPRGLERLSIYLRDLGFNDRAANLVRQFEQDLPISYPTDSSLSLHHLLGRNFEQARTAARRMQRSVPGAEGGWLREGEIDLFAGDLVSAEKSFHAALQAADGIQDYARLRLAHLQLLKGDTEPADALLKQVEANSLQAISTGHEGWFLRWNIAVVHALSGNRDAAVGWLEQAVDSGRRRYEWDEIEPAFQAIHGEPGFAAVLQRQRDLRLEMKQNTDARYFGF